MEGTRLLLLYRQLIAAGRSGPAGEVQRRLYQLGQMLLLAGIQLLLQVGPVTNSCMEMSFLPVFNALLLYHSQQLLSQRKKGAGASPLPTGTKKPRRAALQPHSGEKDEELLFTRSTVVVLNADSDTDIAPLVIAADHNTYIGPDAILVHAGIDIRIDMFRNLSQH